MGKVIRRPLKRHWFNFLGEAWNHGRRSLGWLALPCIGGVIQNTLVGIFLFSSIWSLRTQDTMVVFQYINSLPFSSLWIVQYGLWMSWGRWKWTSTDKMWTEKYINASRCWPFALCRLYIMNVSKVKFRAQQSLLLCFYFWSFVLANF
jgi:hypothetical protein